MCMQFLNKSIQDFSKKPEDPVFKIPDKSKFLILNFRLTRLYIKDGIPSIIFFKFFKNILSKTFFFKN